MPVYSCDHCNYHTKVKGNYLKHLKTMKHQRLSESHLVVTLESPKSIKIQSTPFPCKYCGKPFKYKQGMYRHIKHRCSLALNETNTKEVVEYNSMKEEIKKLKIENEALKSQHKNFINTQNNLNIHINALGHEELDHITDQVIIRCIGQVYNSIPHLLKQIHCHPDHPENANVKIPNKKLPYASVYKQKTGKWETLPRNAVIDDMVDRGYNMLDENYVDIEDKLSADKKDKFKRFQQHYESDPNIKENIKKDVDLIIVDSTR